MTIWLAHATDAERRTLHACFAGWSLDAFDSQIFSFSLPAIIATFALTKADAGFIVALTLVTTAVGGWLGGALSDRVGRVTVLRYSILCFAFASLGVMIAQDATQLLLARAVQGFGFGAEWAAGVVLIAETVRKDYRGRALATVQSGWAVGWGLAAICYAALFSWLPAHQAWRAMFALGGLPILLVISLRRGLVEPDRPYRRSLSNPLLGLFKPAYLPITLPGALLGLGAHGGYYGLFTWLPTYLRTERNLSVMATSGFLTVIIASFFVGCLTAGTLSDRFGRKRTIACYAVGCALMTLLYIAAPVGNATMLALGFPLGFCAAGIPACMAALFSELYPGSERGSGVGFCYNFGRLAAAAFPLLIGAMGDRISLGTAIAIDAASAYALVIVAILLLPRRHRRADMLEFGQG